MKNFVYKYVYNGEVIYIGLTDDIHRRIKEHASGQGLEEKFLPYLDGCEIYYHECGNEVEMQALEKLLINQFKPKLNVVDMQKGASTVVLEMEWKYYTEDTTPERRAELEHEISLCQRNINANNTRIEAYRSEAESLRSEMEELLPFYIQLQIHKDDFVQDPNAYLSVESDKLLTRKTMCIGKHTIEPWYDDAVLQDGIWNIQLSAEFLQKFFTLMHKPNWMQETMDTIGDNRRQDIAQKVANLRRKNEELASKKEALISKLQGIASI